MTIQEASREAEMTIEGGKQLMGKMGDVIGSRHYVDFMETLLEAARKGAAEEIQTEQDELIEESKQLTLMTVSRAILHIEEVIADEDTCVLVDGDRLCMVVEAALHTALAALRKVNEDMVTSGLESLDVPNSRIVTVRVDSPEDKERILKQVERNLQKIFDEAAQK